MQHVVIVESPAKAKTIEKYLGRDYTVLASYGHVRDLPTREGSVRPDLDFAMNYETDAKSNKQLAKIAQAVKGADKLYLATDPDREGEAISWHVLEALKQKRALKDVEIKRVVFNAITKSAVLEAMRQPRDLDMDLVNAQQARRALDYLVGFTLSPVLWRKLPGARSAGRVQSVALRLICEREIEIEAFQPREYWSIEVDFQTADGAKVTGRLVELDGHKLEKFDIADEKAARDIAARLEAGNFTVRDVATKPVKRNPAPPFTTSTLQQEAARKLGFSAQRTMQTAQRLYEGVDIAGETVGLITYMRTDGVQIADEAIRAARDVIGAEFGKEYVPESWRVYKAKAKNAQEAHEAIRPTDFGRLPQDVAAQLDEGQRRLYELIWKRAIASQMESADLERTSIDIADGSGALMLRATGTVVVFPGFLKLYEEGHDDNGKSEDANRLPKLTAGDALARDLVRPEQHFTEPPPRYSEASLVKRLEELGIGRPSTYASILETLRDRNYVRMDKARFLPEDKGRVVTAFLTGFFDRYFTYDFTANLEEQLDEITERRVDWKQVLLDFWLQFSRSEAVLSIKDAILHLDEMLGNRGEVLRVVNELLAPHFFPAREDGKNPRQCPACNQGELAIRTGKNGAFIGCSNYPECRYTRPLAINGDHDDAAMLAEGPKLLGEDPETGLPVTLRRGPYGPYVQLGEAEKDGPKPKRASLGKNLTPDQVDLAIALKLLALPRLVGMHPETGQEITANFGRFGPYVKHDNTYANLDADESPLTVGLNRAVELIAQKQARGAARRGPAPLRLVGPHPEDGQPVEVMNGRYGPYLRHGKINAPLPKGTEPESVSMQEAVEALAARAEQGGKKKKARAPAKKKAAAKKKPSTKKKAAPANAEANGEPAPRRRKASAG